MEIILFHFNTYIYVFFLFTLFGVMSAAAVQSLTAPELKVPSVKARVNNQDAMS